MNLREIEKSKMGKATILEMRGRRREPIPRLDG